MAVLGRHLSATLLAYSAALSLATTDDARAQSDSSWTPPVAAGRRIRVALSDSASRALRGTYQGVAADSVRISFAPGMIMSVPTSQIVYVDESLGRPRWSFAAIGFLGGALLGGSVGAWSGGRNDDTGLGAAVGLVAGVFLGAPVGGITCAIVAPERWARHYNPARR